MSSYSTSPRGIGYYNGYLYIANFGNPPENPPSSAGTAQNYLSSIQQIDINNPIRNNVSWFSNEYLAPLDLTFDLCGNMYIANYNYGCVSLLTLTSDIPPAPNVFTYNWSNCLNFDSSLTYNCPWSICIDNNTNTLYFPTNVTNQILMQEITSSTLNTLNNTPSLFASIPNITTLTGYISVDSSYIYVGSIYSIPECVFQIPLDNSSNIITYVEGYNSAKLIYNNNLYIDDTSGLYQVSIDNPNILTKIINYSVNLLEYGGVYGINNILYLLTNSSEYNVPAIYTYNLQQPTPLYTIQGQCYGLYYYNNYFYVGVNNIACNDSSYNITIIDISSGVVTPNWLNLDSLPVSLAIYNDYMYITNNTTLDTNNKISQVEITYDSSGIPVPNNLITNWGIIDSSYGGGALNINNNGTLYTNIRIDNTTDSSSCIYSFDLSTADMSNNNLTLYSSNPNTSEYQPSLGLCFDSLNNIYVNNTSPFVLNKYTGTSCTDFFSLNGYEYLGSMCIDNNDNLYVPFGITDIGGNNEVSQVSTVLQIPNVTYQTSTTNYNIMMNNIVNPNAVTIYNNNLYVLSCGETYGTSKIYSCPTGPPIPTLTPTPTPTSTTQSPTPTPTSTTQSPTPTPTSTTQSPTPTPTSTQSPTPTPTALSPTLTPTPTALPPTLTPTPTPTALPPTPTPGPTPQPVLLFNITSNASVTYYTDTYYTDTNSSNGTYSTSIYNYIIFENTASNGDDGYVVFNFNSLYDTTASSVNIYYLLLVGGGGGGSGGCSSGSAGGGGGGGGETIIDDYTTVVQFSDSIEIYIGGGGIGSTGATLNSDDNGALAGDDGGPTTIYINNVNIQNAFGGGGAIASGNYAESDPPNPFQCGFGGAGGGNGGNGTGGNGGNGAYGGDGQDAKIGAISGSGYNGSGSSDTTLGYALFPDGFYVGGGGGGGGGQNSTNVSSQGAGAPGAFGTSTGAQSSAAGCGGGGGGYENGVAGDGYPGASGSSGEYSVVVNSYIYAGNGGGGGGAGSVDPDVTNPPSSEQVGGNGGYGSNGLFVLVYKFNS
jgi:hypothetical protein